MQKSEEKVSAYTVLSNWLYDGSAVSKIPKSVIDANEIGSQYLLWYFKNSIYNVYINKHFNNFDIYKLDKEASLKLLKESILSTGFRPKYTPKQKNTTSKIFGILKKRYPYFKSDDIKLLITIIDNSEEKDQIYETLGLYNPKKKKTNAQDRKQFKKTIEEIQPVEKKEVIKKNQTLLDIFMEGFVIERK